MIITASVVADALSLIVGHFTSLQELADEVYSHRDADMATDIAAGDRQGCFCELAAAIKQLQAQGMYPSVWLCGRERGYLISMRGPPSSQTSPGPCGFDERHAHGMPM